MRALPIPALILILLGCGDPLTVRDVSTVDRSIRVFMVLDADSTRQALLLESLDPGGTFEDLRAELHTAGGATVVGQNNPPGVDYHLPCSQRYGVIGTNAASACVVFETAVEPGRLYELVVSARQRPPARAQTTVPDAFAIVALSLAGQPPGTDGVDAHWNTSPHAHGYFAFLRAQSTDCEDVRGCPGGWSVSTTDTVVSGSIPEKALEDGSGPWTFEVIALDRGLYQYLTSGTGNDLFSVPPIENVDGGHGVLGSWRRATRSAAP